MSHFPELISELSTYLTELKKEIPEVMAGFATMHHAANQDNALSYKTKELIALAIGVATHCDSCIGMHMKTLIKLGVTRAEILETLSVAIYMGGGPSLMYAAKTLQAFAELTKQ